MAGNDTIAKLKKDGILIKKEEKFQIKDEERIGVYFSAHWCPPCQHFTPLLANFYNQCKEQGKKFEIIFVSSDRDQAAFDEYYKDMPWAALKFDERDMKNDVASMNGIRGIPSLVIFSKDGTVVTTEGRAQVQSNKDDPNKCEFLNY